MNQKTRGLIGLNIAVLIMSIAGLFAKLIPWPAPMIILGRAAVTAPCVAAYLLLRRRTLVLKCRRHAVILFGLGILMVAHWITYFAAIQVSTVAIGILAVFTSPIMATFLEPMFDGKKAHRADVLLALVAFAGIVLMVDDFSLSNGTFQGVLLGLISALLVTLRNIWSKSLVQEYAAPFVMFWQMFFGALVLSPLVFFVNVTVSTGDIQNLLILGVFATAIAHTLMLTSIGCLGARSTGVIMMIQPLYAILLAVVLLGEIPSLRVIVGGALVLSAMIVETVKQARSKEGIEHTIKADSF